MTATINNKSQVAHSHRVLANKGDVLPPLNVEDLVVLHDKDEEWKFTPLCKPHGLHNGTAADPVIASTLVEIAGQDGVAVDVVKCDDEHLGRVGAPTDRVVTQTHPNFDDTHTVTFTKNSASKESIVINTGGLGEDNIPYDHIVIDVQSHAGVVCVISYRGSGIFADNIESAIGDNTKLSVVTMMNWNEDAVHSSAHYICVGRDATLRYAIATFGGGIVRIVPYVAFTAPGGGADLLGVCFAGAGQYFENCTLVDYAVPNYRSNMMYEGTLQGESNIAHHEVRIVRVGDVFIRAKTTGINTYEFNRNLSLIKGARADTVPSLEIETDEIAGAGHAATASRPDEEQSFYLLSRDIPELAARRLVVCDFFSEAINLIPVESAYEKPGKPADEELNTVDF